MSPESDLACARAVADAVMYEGYLLYPYRASAAKNQIRWQFGVLGPHGAAAAGVGEEPELSTEILVRRATSTTVTVRLRFLQLQSRSVESVDAAGGFVSVDELEADGQRWQAWDEAVDQEVVVATVPVGDGDIDQRFPIAVKGAAGDTTVLRDRSGRPAGRLVRSRRPLNAAVHVKASMLADYHDVSRLQVRVENLATLAAPAIVSAHPQQMDQIVGGPVRGSVDRNEAVALSLIGAHLLLTCESGEFVSLLDPPTELQSAARECEQHRCWPVLAGPAGSAGVVLVSPIILEDHPRLAEESAGALFDSTEIDEILTLRILSMTEDEKSQARATDPRAAQIIDRSENLSFAQMSRLHGALRNPHAVGDPMSTWDALNPLEPLERIDALTDPTTEVPWWDPDQDASVDPGTDTVVVAGQVVRRGTLVRIHPNRRADAQDLFFADQIARVSGVHFDVDGATHVGVVLVDDPAADLHDWYGRYLYFDPDEIEPIETKAPAVQWKES